MWPVRGSESALDHLATSAAREQPLRGTRGTRERTYVFFSFLLLRQEGPRHVELLHRVAPVLQHRPIGPFRFH